MSQRHRDAELPVPAEARAASARARRAASDPRRAVQRGRRRSAPGSTRPTCTSRGRRGSPSTTAIPTWLEASWRTAHADARHWKTEDVEAAHGDAPGAGRSDAPRRRVADDVRRRVSAWPSSPGVSQRWRSSSARSCHSSTVKRVADVVLPLAVDLEHAHGDTLLRRSSFSITRRLLSLRGTMLISSRCSHNRSKANSTTTTTPSATRPWPA